MNFKHKDAQIFAPDGIEIKEALSRTTHMAIGAHQDDVEIMAYDGIIECYDSKAKWFSAVVVTDGTGSIRMGSYSNCTDREFKMVRFSEQIQAAKIGKYGSAILLDYPSTEVKSPDSKDIVTELSDVISAASPDIMYIHNLTDKHLTHVGVAVKTILAIRSLPKEKRPSSLFGCEVWRSLDWMNDNDKTVFDVDRNTTLAKKLLSVYESQISGAKKYDKAALARRLANSTFFESIKMDSSKALSFAMDLTPLIKDDMLDISSYAVSYIESFKNEVLENIYKVTKENPK